MKAPYLHIAVLAAFLANTFGPMPYAQAQDFHLPAPGVMVRLSPEFNPPILKGIRVHPEDPFQFEFILNKGDRELDNDQLKDESSKLIRYFLASLTIPEKDLWVNLSPYEKDRIIPQSFGLTEMGRDVLAEDYMLKQITASLIYPEDEIGRKFWKRIYEEASKKYGTTNIPVNTFNKVWIVPEKAVVYENAKAGTAYVVESRLKVMLDQDYLSLQKHSDGVITSETKQSLNSLGSQVVREIVIPELAKEVNEDKNFFHLRQVYNSLILAAWYKKKIKDSILAQVYDDQNKVLGVNIDDPKEKQRIYERYLQAFKKGAYNYIKEETDPLTQQIIPRKYFSGGAALWEIDKAMVISDKAEVAANIEGDPADELVSVSIKDAAMAGKVENAQSLGERSRQEDLSLIDAEFDMQKHVNLHDNPDLGGIPNKNGHLMAIFDGHSRSGQGGDELTQFVKAQLPDIFSQQLLNFRGDVQKSLAGTFRRLDRLTRDYTSGTTATVVYVPQGSEKIYYAVLGDSPFFIIKKDGSFELAPMHTLEDFHQNPEVARIQKYFERNEGVIAPTGIYVTNDEGKTKSSKVPRALGSKELGSVISKVPDVGVMETDLADVRTMGIGSDGILSDANDSKASIQKIVRQVNSGMSAKDIIDDRSNNNEDNRSLVLWHPADQAMTADLDGKKFHPGDPKRFGAMLKFFASDNPTDLFREQNNQLTARDWQRFFERFGGYRRIKGMPGNRGLDSIERIPNTEVFSGMEEDLRARLPDGEATSFIAELRGLQHALESVQGGIPKNWDTLKDEEKIWLAYFNKAVMSGIIDSSLPVSDRVATTVLNDLIGQWRSTQALSDNDFWQIFKVNKQLLSTTAMRRALVRAIYVGDYFQVAKRKNVRLNFRIKTATGSVEVDGEKFIIKDQSGHEIAGATEQLERSTLEHVRTFAMQYIMEGLERFPTGLIAKMQEPMNVYFYFDLTSTRNGVTVAHYSPRKDIPSRYLAIQIDGNPHQEQLNEIVTSLDHEMIHYLAMNLGEEGEIFPIEDYRDLMRAIGFKRFLLKLNGEVEDRTSTISGLGDIYKYYDNLSPYFYAVRDPKKNKYVVYEEGGTKKYAHLKSLLDPSEFELFPDAGLNQHYFLDPDEVVAYTASETREMIENVLSQKSLNNYDVILGILQRHLLRSGPVAKKKDGTMIYEVYAANEADSEDGFAATYRDGHGKTYSTLKQAMAAGSSSGDQAMSADQGMSAPKGVIVRAYTDPNNEIVQKWILEKSKDIPKSFWKGLGVNNYKILLAFNNNEPIAGLAMHRDKNVSRVMYIDALEVMPEYRKRGIAISLIVQMVKEALAIYESRFEDADIIRLHLAKFGDKEERELEKYYTNLGFELMPRDPDEGEDAYQWMNLTKGSGELLVERAEEASSAEDRAMLSRSIEARLAGAVRYQQTAVLDYESPEERALMIKYLESKGRSFVEMTQEKLSQPGFLKKSESGTVFIAPEDLALDEKQMSHLLGIIHFPSLDESAFKTIKDVSDGQEEYFSHPERDYLTGLYNRRGFTSRFKQFLESSIRLHGRVHMLMAIMDIDYFKAINDLFKHDVGDEVLKNVGDTLPAGTRSKTDIIGRWGGEEFALVLPITDRPDSVPPADFYKGLERIHSLINYKGSIFNDRDAVIEKLRLAVPANSPAIYDALIFQLSLQNNLPVSFLKHDLPTLKIAVEAAEGEVENPDGKPYNFNRWIETSSMGVIEVDQNIKAPPPAKPPSPEKGTRSSGRSWADEFLNQAVKQADEHLYRAKQGGRNRIEHGSFQGDIKDFAMSSRPEPAAGSLVNKPERELNEKTASLNGAIGLQLQLDSLLSELRSIIGASNAGPASELATAQAVFIQNLRSFYRDIPEVLGTTQGFNAYSQMLKDDRAKRDQLYDGLEEAQETKDKDKLKRLNLEAIDLNRRILKLQVLLAGMMLSGKSKLSTPSMQRNAALFALEGAVNTVRFLQDELRYRIGRLSAAGKVRTIETTDWLGKIVRSHRLGAFDIELAPSQEGQEPSVTIRQERWVNIHTRLNDIFNSIKKGNIQEGINKLDVLARIFRTRYISINANYEEIIQGMDLLKTKLKVLTDGEYPSAEQLSDISQSVQGLISSIRFPKQRIWVDVVYEDIAAAFRSYIHRLSGYVEEIGNISYYLTMVKVDIASLEDALKRGKMGGRRKEIMVSGLGQGAAWAERGFVHPKQFSEIKLRAAIEDINNGALAQAIAELKNAQAQFQKRLDEIDSIVDRSKIHAASVYATYRDTDILNRLDSVISGLTQGKPADALDNIKELEELYFDEDQEFVEPGLNRVQKGLEYLDEYLSSRSGILTEENVSEVKRYLETLKKDIEHKSSFRIIVTENRYKKYVFVNPGTTVYGLVNMGQRNPADVIVKLAGNILPWSELGKVKLADLARVEIADRAMASAVLDKDKMIAAKKQAERIVRLKQYIFSVLYDRRNNTEIAPVYRTMVGFLRVLESKKDTEITDEQLINLLDGVAARHYYGRTDKVDEFRKDSVKVAKIRENINKAWGSGEYRLSFPAEQLNLFPDKAMKANPTGGVDLTPANMNLQTLNNGGPIKFHLDPAMLQQLHNAPGFVPVIINIQPMTNLRGFLGLAENQSHVDVGA